MGGTGAASRRYMPPVPTSASQPVQNHYEGSSAREAPFTETGGRVLPGAHKRRLPTLLLSEAAQTPSHGPPKGPEAHGAPAPAFRMQPAPPLPSRSLCGPPIFSKGSTIYSQPHPGPGRGATAPGAETRLPVLTASASSGNKPCSGGEDAHRGPFSQTRGQLLKGPFEPRDATVGVFAAAHVNPQVLMPHA